MFCRALVILLLSGPLLAQASSSPSSASSGSRQRRPSIPGGVRSLKGCLVEDQDKGTVLVSQRGSRVPLSSAEDLSVHIGQQVKASGTFVDKEQSENSDPKSKAESKLHPEQEFRVLKIDVLSQTCSAGKKK